MSALKRLALGLSLSLACLSSLSLAYELKPVQVTDNTWVLEGSRDDFNPQNGGNIANISFIATPAGVILIDTGPSLAYGKALDKVIRDTTGQEVKLVLITHHHPDHMLGNQPFAQAEIGALASTNALIASESDAMAESLYRLVGDRMRGTEVVAPNRVVKQGPLELGGYKLQLLELQGHSGADLAVLDEQTGVLFAGDMLFYQRALATPHSPGLDVWLKDLDRLQALPWKVLVPGHGPVTQDDAPFVQMRDYLNWLDQTLTQAAIEGADMLEVMRTPIPERFADISLTRHELARTVSHLYPRYEQAQWQ